MACFIMSISVASSVGSALAMGAVAGVGVCVLLRARERDVDMPRTQQRSMKPEI